MGPAFLYHAPLLLSLVMDRAVAVQEMCAAPGVPSSQCEASSGGWEPCSEGGRGPAGPARHQGTGGALMGAAAGECWQGRVQEEKRHCFSHGELQMITGT